MDIDVVVVGAGAAGQMCAAQAGQRGRTVLLVDHWHTIGERIRISGGGRCNFSNREVGAQHYVSVNPHFCRSALARYTPGDFIALLERHQIPFEERAHGQLFCLRSAHDIIEMLRKECDAAQVHVDSPCRVDAITPRVPDPTSPARFEVATDHGTFRCRSVVIATGGLAVPQIGATPFGYQIAEQFGLRVIPPRPALVPLTLTAEAFAPLVPLSGVAFDSETSCSGRSGSPHFREQTLITHRGLSGPAILQISSYWQHQSAARGATGSVALNLVPGVDAERWLVTARESRRTLVSVLADVIPRRLAQALCLAHGWPATTAEISNRSLAHIAQVLTHWTFEPAGTLGFSKAEVTLGGVDTRDLSSKTMEAAGTPGLYFVGEVVDVTGWLGGYNFQWAWSSGWVAGQFV
jgi:predicted Rossmann fold flavoprotein